jgi:hypothetical protein
VRHPVEQRRSRTTVKVQGCRFTALGAMTAASISRRSVFWSTASPV